MYLQKDKLGPLIYMRYVNNVSIMRGTLSIIHIFADALLHRICHFFSYNSIIEKKNGFYFCSMFVLFSPPNRWMWLKVGKQLPWPLMEEKLSPPPPKYILQKLIITRLTRTSSMSTDTVEYVINDMVIFSSWSIIREKAVFGTLESIFKKI
jgi:hypothetical protein